MPRLLPLFAAAALVGCTPTDPPPPAPPPAPPAAGIDFAGWPSVTELPHVVDSETVFLCDLPRGSSPAEFEKDRRRRHGPHSQPAIVVRTNPEALADFKAGRSPMPVGTTVVKEKHPDIEAKNPPAEYGAMVKREPGYDPAHGDWEYVYVGADKAVTRGRVDTCIDCHAQAADRDYLFRTYLKK